MRNDFKFKCRTLHTEPTNFPSKREHGHRMVNTNQADVDVTSNSPHLFISSSTSSPAARHYSSTMFLNFYSFHKSIAGYIINSPESSLFGGTRHRHFAHHQQHHRMHHKSRTGTEITPTFRRNYTKPLNLHVRTARKKAAHLLKSVGQSTRRSYFASSPVLLVWQPA